MDHKSYMDAWHATGALRNWSKSDEIKVFAGEAALLSYVGQEFHWDGRWGNVWALDRKTGELTIRFRKAE